MRTSPLVSVQTLKRPHFTLVTAAQMQSLDRRTIDEAKVPGLTLMERAGKGVVQVLEQQFWVTFWQTHHRFLWKRE